MCFNFPQSKLKVNYYTNRNGDFWEDGNEKPNFKGFNWKPLGWCSSSENSAPLSSSHPYFHFTIQSKLAINNTLSVYRAFHLRIYKHFVNTNELSFSTPPVRHILLSHLHSTGKSCGFAKGQSQPAAELGNRSTPWTSPSAQQCKAFNRCSDAPGSLKSFNDLLELPVCPDVWLGENTKGWTSTHWENFNPTYCWTWIYTMNISHTLTWNYHSQIWSFDRANRRENWEFGCSDSVFNNNTNPGQKGKGGFPSFFFCIFNCS